MPVALGSWPASGWLYTRSPNPLPYDSVLFPLAYSSLMWSFVDPLCSFSSIRILFSAGLVVLGVEVIVLTYPFAFVTVAELVLVASVCHLPSVPRTRTILFVLFPDSSLLWNRNSTRLASCGTVISICLLPAMAGVIA